MPGEFTPEQSRSAKESGPDHARSALRRYSTQPPPSSAPDVRGTGRKRCVIQLESERAAGRHKPFRRTGAGEQRKVESAFLFKVKPVVEKVAKDQGLQFVFDLDSGLIAWADPSTDITSEVVKQLAVAVPPNNR